MRSRTWKKIIIIGAIVLLVVAYKFLGLDQYLTLAFLKESQALFTEFYQTNPATVIASYMGIYILVTALSLPGATVMTLAGGALFGLLVGVVITSFASTIGATLACFVARFLLRDWVQNKFAVRLKAINDGIAREGGFYLFTLRLIPVFPFFVINLAMGLTRMSLFRFYWISQLGMLPGTIVYVNAGKELGEIESLSGILSPGLIFSFVILGAFPLIAKKIVEWIRARRSTEMRQ